MFLDKIDYLLFCNMVPMLLSALGGVIWRGSYNGTQSRYQLSVSHFRWSRVCTILQPLRDLFLFASSTISITSPGRWCSFRLNCTSGEKYPPSILRFADPTDLAPATNSATGLMGEFRNFSSCKVIAKRIFWSKDSCKKEGILIT